jgi:excisionase family DNA binding protein
MYVSSPEQRHQMWDTAVPRRGEERETLLHYIVLDMHTELSALDLYDYRELLEEAVQILDSADRFMDHAMLMAYQALGVTPEGTDDDAKAEAPARLLAEIAARLASIAGDDSADPAMRMRAAEASEFWRKTLQESERDHYLSVAQVAARHGVTPQAVYKWIHRGKIEAEERPGGSYRIPAFQFRSSAALMAKRADTRRRLLELQDGQPMTEDEIVAVMRENRHADDPR